MSLMATRRMVAQMLGFVPVILPQLTKAGIMSEAKAASGIGLVGEAVADKPYSPSPATVERNKAFNKIYQALEDRSRRQYQKREAVQRGLDADIACLKSVSQVNKVRMQMERDEEETRFHTAVRQILENPVGALFGGEHSGNAQNRTGG
jgi:membrane-associated HD superfamily phosphohydrolase